MSFYIYTLGCKVNTYESEYIKELLLKENYYYDEINPKIIIINTCSVTNMADNKSKKMVRHFKNNYPDAIIVVCGCSSQNNPDDYQNLGIDILIGNQKKSEIPKLIKDYLKKNENYKYINNNRKLLFENMNLEKFTTHTRAYVKIEDGCDNFCSYCVIPYVRGSVRCKDFSLILKEVQTLVENHHQEIILTGIHTGSYHFDNYDLTDLIHEISKIKDLKRIRISSIEITELNDKFLEELKNNPKICNHLHIPLQSGSDFILKKMNRKYNLYQFKTIIEKIRNIRKDIAITTDVIVAHPYETEKEFNETLETCKEINFAKIHVFPYSKRFKTASAAMPMQVSDNDKKIRSKKLIALSNELEKAYYQKYLNQELEILIIQNHEYSIGITDNYLKVKINQNIPVNTFVKAKIIDYKNGYLTANLVNNIIKN